MRTITAFALVGSALAALAVEHDARACGGCFHPPTETNSVITDHRMVFAVSPQQTTLYDQIKYQGNPADFAWVLPIQGQVTIGISADSMFGALDAMTTTTVVAPDANCPPAPQTCKTAQAPVANAAGGGASDGVQVISQQVVGPYATVQLRSTDPQALNTWLQQNGYAVTPDVQPVIDEYVKEHFDFLALRLKPGAGVQAMRPVRVSTPGAGLALPLRMVAAGTGATVGITLWVVAEGRYDAQNFTNFQITADELVWDWPSQSSNYKTLRAQHDDGKSWETESSMAFPATTVQNAVKYGYFSPSGGFGGAAPAAVNDYQPVTDTNGNVVETADQVRDADLQVLLGGLTNVRITRMRSDLAHASLATDLTLEASADQSELAAQRKATKETGEPMCPVYSGCNVTGQAPRSQAQAEMSGNGTSSFSCSASGTSRAPITLGAIAAFLGLAIVRTRSRKTRV